MRGHRLSGVVLVTDYVLPRVALVRQLVRQSFSSLLGDGVPTK
jgi:hypothetical protein